MPAEQPQLPQAFDLRQAKAAGFTEEQVRWRLRRGEWRRLRPGVFCLQATWAAADRRGRLVLTTTAAVMKFGPGVWASHTSAAAVLRLPTPSKLTPVTLTRSPPAATRHMNGLTIHVAGVPKDDRWSVHGLAVTSLQRTVADCLRGCAPADALAVLDAALAGSRTLRPDVAAVLAACAGWPGARQASQLLSLGDGRRESPLESWSAWVMHAFGVPAPEPQRLIFDEHGVFIGRSDFWWQEFGAIGEADGRVKYDVGDVRNARDAQDRLIAEKRREERLRDTGADVIRWGAIDLERPQEWARSLVARLKQRRGRNFRGRTRPSQAD